MADAPAVLIIAGLDPSGGAGLIADVRVCELHGCRPLAVATALTVQSTRGLDAVNPVDPAVVSAQLAALVGDVDVAAVKIGMVGSVEMAAAIARIVDPWGVPVVWDPVARPTIGATVVAADQLRALARHLGPVSALVTPNLDEASALVGDAITDATSVLAAARTIRDGYQALSVLIKGGHWGDPDEATDVFVRTGEAVFLAGPRHRGADVHGTGCALSTAITCHLAKGASFTDACRWAKAWVAARIAAPVRPGRGRAAIV